MPFKRSAHNSRYGRAHRRLRQSWAPQVRTGTVDCARCGEPILPGEAWDLGHADDGHSYQGPEHAGRCNRAAGARNAGRPADPQPRQHTRW